jgi:hypothetical protein
MCLLRDHPLMSCRGLSNWPPVWTLATPEGKQKVIRDELWVLRHVRAYEESSTKCYLIIEYEGQRYIGALLFDNVAFCRQITALLQRHLGDSIQEIGDLDL